MDCRHQTTIPNYPNNQGSLFADVDDHVISQHWWTDGLLSSYHPDNPQTSLSPCRKFFLVSSGLIRTFTYWSVGLSGENIKLSIQLSTLYMRLHTVVSRFVSLMMKDILVIQICLGYIHDPPAGWCLTQGHNRVTTCATDLTTFTPIVTGPGSCWTRLAASSGSSWV